MSEMQGFGKLFVNRSVKMLDANWVKLKEQDVEVTTLVSCVLCLLCLIESGLEHKAGRTRLEENSLKAFFSDTPLFYKFRPDDLDENTIITNQSLLIKEEVICDDSQNNKFESLVKKIRNSFAHGNVLPINDSGKWVGIRAWNRKQNDTIDFIFEIETEKLLDFYKKLALLYRDSVK